MEICFRRKELNLKKEEEKEIEGGHKEEVHLTKATEENKIGFQLDDLDLADSDREDYHNNVDILFVVDATGSMGSYIEQSKVTIKKIIERFSSMEFNIKFSLCAYRVNKRQVLNCSSGYLYSLLHFIGSSSIGRYLSDEILRFGFG
jgi:Mg-chelatase subunit ChlD